MAQPTRQTIHGPVRDLVNSLTHAFSLLQFVVVVVVSAAAAQRKSAERFELCQLFLPLKRVVVVVVVVHVAVVDVAVVAAVAVAVVTCQQRVEDTQVYTICNCELSPPRRELEKHLPVCRAMTMA